MEPVPAVRFARVARDLSAAAKAAGLVAPAFRTPPRRAGAVRTIRRLPAGPVVAVRLQGRVFGAVVDDMIDGVVAVNGLRGDGASRVVTMLRAAVADNLPGEPGWRNRQTQAA